MMRNTSAGLRVVHVVLSLDVGGLERVVLHLAQQGRVSGQNVMVVCLERRGILAAEAEEAGARVICLDKPPGITPGLTRQFQSLFKELRPDIVHTHQIGALFYAGPAAKSEAVPIIHTEHIDNTTKPLSRNRRLRTRLLWWWAARRADRFVCVSADIAAVARSFVAARKIVVIDNGIATAPFDAADSRDEVRRGLSIPTDALVIGTVARLNEVKRQDLLIRAVAQVRRRHAGVQLLLVGDGPSRRTLEDLTKELEMSDAVHFAGYQSAPHRFLQAMDVFALPSRIEGLPLAILEAWAARLPVVASRVGGVARVVRDGEDGLLFSSGNEPALVLALQKMIDDSELRRRLGIAGRARVDREFHMRRMADDYIRHYLQLIEARGGRRPESPQVPAASA